MEVRKKQKKEKKNKAGKKRSKEARKKKRRGKKERKAPNEKINNGTFRKLVESLTSTKKDKQREISRKKLVENSGKSLKHGA